MREERFPSITIESVTLGYVVEIRQPQKKMNWSGISGLSAPDYYETEIRRFAAMDWHGVLKILDEEAGWFIPDWFRDKIQNGDMLTLEMKVV